MDNDFSERGPRRELYRDPSRGKICGVCAGIADYFGLELWVVRIIAVSALIFMQFPVFIAYVIAYFVLDPKPGTTDTKGDKFKESISESLKESLNKSKTGRGSSSSNASVQQVWKKGTLPGQKISQLSNEFNHLESRLRHIETYVTSKQFELRKEFETLKK
jgi:phage shock protein C